MQRKKKNVYPFTITITEPKNQPRTIIFISFSFLVNVPEGVRRWDGTDDGVPGNGWWDGYKGNERERKNRQKRKSLGG